MERLRFAFLISLLLCTCGCVTDLDQEYGHAVRPIGVGGQEAWNRRSVWFMYAPTFDFTNRSDAVKYVFDVTDSAGATTLYEDDGDSLGYRTGDYALTRIVQKGGEVSVGKRTGSFKGMPSDLPKFEIVREVTDAVQRNGIRGIVRGF